MERERSWCHSRESYRRRSKGRGHGHFSHTGIPPSSWSDCSRTHGRFECRLLPMNTALPGQREMREAAVRMSRAVGFSSVGSIWFLQQPEKPGFAFLEMKTSLGEDHAVS